MSKLVEIRKNQEHIGSILCDRILCDPRDNYLMFMHKRECVAMFPAENIELSPNDFDRRKAIEAFDARELLYQY